jgi:hypothetical protein
MRYHFYQVNEREKLHDLLLDDIGVEHDVLGLEVKPLSDNDACAVKLVPSKSESKEHRVSNELLKEMKLDGVIEKKSDTQQNK